MKNKWIDVRKKKPKNGQNVFFVSTADKEVLIGFYVQSEKHYGDGHIGSFIIGTVYNKKDFLESRFTKPKGCSWGIGFNVWKQNGYEVTYWKPIELPKFNFPKKKKHNRTK